MGYAANGYARTGRRSTIPYLEAARNATDWHASSNIGPRYLITFQSLGDVFHVWPAIMLLRRLQTIFEFAVLPVVFFFFFIFQIIFVLIILVSHVIFLCHR